MSPNFTRANNLTKQTALSEKGDVINGRGDTPNRHDVLTGSQPDGTAFPAGEDRTCKNWTSSTQGAAMLGHSDRIGLRDDDASKSWNSSHPSRGPEGGCSQADLREHRRGRPAVLFRGELTRPEKNGFEITKEAALSGGLCLMRKSDKLKNRDGTA